MIYTVLHLLPDGSKVESYVSASSQDEAIKKHRGLFESSSVICAFKMSTSSYKKWEKKIESEYNQLQVIKNEV